MDPAVFQANFERIGFSVPASVYIIAPPGQGILFEDLDDLADKDVSTLSSTLRWW